MGSPAASSSGRIAQQGSGRVQKAGQESSRRKEMKTGKRQKRTEEQRWEGQRGLETTKDFSHLLLSQALGKLDLLLLIFLNRTLEVWLRISLPLWGCFTLFWVPNL